MALFQIKQNTWTDIWKIVDLNVVRKYSWAVHEHY